MEQEDELEISDAMLKKADTLRVFIGVAPENELITFLSNDNEGFASRFTGTMAQASTTAKKMGIPLFRYTRNEDLHEEKEFFVGMISVPRSEFMFYNKYAVKIIEKITHIAMPGTTEIMFAIQIDPTQFYSIQFIETGEDQPIILNIYPSQDRIVSQT